MFGSAFAAAILYASVSIRSFHSRVLGTLLRVLRNILIAVPAGFLFTIATSALYSHHPVGGLAPGYTILGIQFWSYFNVLFSVGDGPVWSCLAFVMVSAFGLEYTRRRRGKLPGIALHHRFKFVRTQRPTNGQAKETLE